MAAKRPLVWQIYPYVLGTTLVCLAAAIFYTSAAMRQFYLRQVAKHLEETAALLTPGAEDRLAREDYEGMQRFCRQAGAASGIRVTVILPSGRVVGDAFNYPGDMENHANRPEIRDAMVGRSGTATRYSATLTQRMMYVAVPLRADGSVAGVLRTAVSVSTVDEALKGIYRRIFAGALLIALVVLPVCLLVARRISRPAEELKKGAERFSSGDLDHRLPIPSSMEMAALAESMNQMAARLDNRIQTVLRQRNDLEALLSSMTEGVLAIDQSEKVIFTNRAVARLLKAGPGSLVGRNIQEILRSPDFERLVQKALSSAEPVEGDVTLFLDRERFVRVHGAPLMDTSGRHIGTLFVIDDVTQIKLLETMRRDFAANVSHEIRTPITAIKGFVETLLDDDRHRPEDTRRFLTIIHRHVERLIAIIEDLISLSRIEQQVEASGIEKKTSRLLPVIERAVAASRPRAEERGIRIETACGEELSAPINAALLERAVANLVDNAVHYSERGATVVVTAARRGGELTLGVEDEGIGIPQKHLPRLFERFYRVDRARSRESGGTGLGLAIVKHIALAHSGSVGVESAPGKGSRFELRLPLAPDTGTTQGAAQAPR